MSKKQEKFQFKGFYIKKSSIEINNPIAEEHNLIINFSKLNSIPEDNEKFILYLSVSIAEKADAININVDMVGFFEFDNSITEEERVVFFNTSAPAILFPYLRAYISSLTSLSGINSVVLPTLNLSRGAVDN